jgi:hypothetical protein
VRVPTIRTGSIVRQDCPRRFEFMVDFRNGNDEAAACQAGRRAPNWAGDLVDLGIQDIGPVGVGKSVNSSSLRIMGGVSLQLP